MNETTRIARDDPRTDRCPGMGYNDMLDADTRRVPDYLFEESGFDMTTDPIAIEPYVSAEFAHQRLLDTLGKPPLLNLGLRLGEGSGAALALGIVKAAAACHSGMASFAEAGVATG